MKKINLLFCIIIISANGFTQEDFYNAQRNFYIRLDNDSTIYYANRSIEKKENLSESLLLRGAAKLYLNDILSATEDLKKSKDLDPTNVKVYLYLGRAFYLSGFNYLAIKELDKAIQIDPSNPIYFDFRALINIEIGNFLQAIEDENLAIDLDSSILDYFGNRGYAKSNLGLYEEAIADYKKALNLGISSKVMSNLGISLLNLNMYMEAYGVLSNAIDLAPKAIDLHFYRGQALIGLERKQEACLDFEESLKRGFREAQKLILKYCK